MKKIKCIISIIVLLIILSGCTVKSDVVVNYDGKVSEKVTFKAPSSGLSESDFNNRYNMTLKYYKDALDTRKYKSSIIYGKENGSVVLTNNFDNICEFINKTVFSQYIYKHISCTETENYYEIKNETSHIAYCSDCNTWPVLDNVEFNLTLPINAEENNADSVNKKTYTWKFDSTTSDDKGLYIKINKNDFEKNAKKEKNKNKVINGIKNNSYIFIFVILALVIVIAGKVLYDKYKNNKLEY